MEETQHEHEHEHQQCGAGVEASTCQGYGSERDELKISIDPGEHNNQDTMNSSVGVTETHQIQPERRIRRKRMVTEMMEREVEINNNSVNRNSAKGSSNDETVPSSQAKIPAELVKGHDSSNWESEDDFSPCEIPPGSSVLHIASKYGKDDLVERIITAKLQDPTLLALKNHNGDTPLHVAARYGRVSTVKILLNAIFCNVARFYSQDHSEEILAKNNQGNTFLHEALFNEDKGAITFLLSDEAAQFEGGEFVQRNTLNMENNEEKSVLYLAIEAGYKQVVDQIMDKLKSLSQSRTDYVPAGKSPLLAAIIRKDEDILDNILKRKPEWIHLRDLKGRIPLHYAASTGYLQGVKNLLEKCPSCANEPDHSGFLPLHLASYEGHVEVVQKLLKHCRYLRDTLDNSGQNILHLAVKGGKLNMVKHILRNIINNESDERGMINDKDELGNTPLHSATLFCHPKIVHALTWDKRVNFTLVNAKHQTALDACGRNRSSLAELLTWIALKSAGVPYANTLSCSVKDPPKSTETVQEQNNPKMDSFKDGISTLMVVSTLMITAAFSAGFTIPGGGDSSDAVNRLWYKIFIFCTAISMYGSLGVTLILFWARLGNIHLAILAVKLAKPLLGFTITTLSVAFLAGVHLVISDMKWLAITILAMNVAFTIILLLLYIHVWLPSSSRCKLVRYISYYPFLMVASLVEHD